MSFTAYLFFSVGCRLKPGQTIEQSWIPHATLLDVNVEVVAKHYPTLLDETFKFKLALNLFFDCNHVISDHMLVA